LGGRFPAALEVGAAGEVMRPADASIGAFEGALFWGARKGALIVKGTYRG
jgi:hypothetical protein